MSMNRWIGNENVMPIQNDPDSIHLQRKIKFTSKFMNLGKIILKTRPPKNKSFIFSLICISYLYIFRCEFTTCSSNRIQKSIGKLNEQLEREIAVHRWYGAGNWKPGRVSFAGHGGRVDTKGKGVVGEIKLKLVFKTSINLIILYFLKLCTIQRCPY